MYPRIESLPQEALADGVDNDLLAALDLPEEDLLAQGVLDVALDGAAQRAGAEHRVEAALGQQLLIGRPISPLSIFSFTYRYKRSKRRIKPIMHTLSG